MAIAIMLLVLGRTVPPHHVMFTQVRRIERAVLFTSLGLLLVVSLLPFPTRLLADYLAAATPSTSSTRQPRSRKKRNESEHR